MGQWDSESAAALARIKSEELSASPTREFMQKLTVLSGSLADLVGMTGAGAIGHICAALMDLAPAKDRENFFYFGEAVVGDIDRVSRFGEETRRLVEENLRKKEAAETLANATLHIPRTNLQARLQRLAHIFTNGVRQGELELESTDDMMRAAVELKEADVILLGKIYDSQIDLVNRQLRIPGTAPTGWHGEIQQVWRDFVNHGGLNPQEHLRYRSSLSRLSSIGLIQQIDITNTYGVGLDIHALLIEGKIFCERIQEIKS